MKAILNTYRQSPRKVRLLADLIRGKNAIDAKNVLQFADKKAGPVFSKLLDSAISNAKNNFSVEADALFVKEVTVNAGVTLKRSMPRARGSAFPINKRTSHILISLGLLADKKSGKKAKKEAKSEEKVAEVKAEKPKVAKKTVSKKAKAK